MPSQIYSLTLTPEYVPSARAPEALTGQVAFAESVTRRVVCRVEVRAAWAAGGDVDVAAPDPPSLPGLSTEEIQERARGFVAQFRDDKLRDVSAPDGEDRELESVQASG